MIQSKALKNSLVGLTFPLAKAFGIVVSTRNKLYDQKAIKVKKVKVPVVSVGNITVGGTGKTPILAELVHWALSSGLKIGVVSRGYKGKFKGVSRVSHTDPDAPVIYGDEPTMLSEKFPDVPIYVSPDRVLAAQTLIEENDVQVIFADDAFQHRRLHRDIDVVVVDCTEPLSNYNLLPYGRLREPLESLKRANYIILNKVNLVSPEEKNNVIDLLESLSDGLSSKIIESEYYVKALKFNSEAIELGDIAPTEPFLLVSGIGNPQALETNLSQFLKIKKHIRYSDHHNYSKKDVRYILKSHEKEQTCRIIITEKDAVKLRSYSELNGLTLTTLLSPKLSLKAKGLYEEVLRVII